MQGEFKPSFYFYDLNSKLTLNPTSKDILTFSFYNGKDDLDKSQTYDNFFIGAGEPVNDIQLTSTLPLGSYNHVTLPDIDRFLY